VKRVETVLALIVQQVGRPKMAVLNVFHVALVCLVMVAKIVPQVMQEKVMTRMPHNANNASWVKPPRLKVRLNVIRVTLVHLAAATVFVLPAPLVFIKMSKVKTNVLNVNKENYTSMLKRLAVGAI
jgi:hypothetical protein